MMRSPFILITIVFGLAHPYKFLCYSPVMGKSHLNYLEKLSDALVNAGHEVVMLSPIIDTKIVRSQHIKASVIEIPQCAETKQMDAEMEQKGGFVENMWKVTGMIDLMPNFLKMRHAVVKQCNATRHHPGLMEQLRAEHFDAAFLEVLDFCGIGIIYELGIEKLAITQSMSMWDGAFPITGAPDFPSYVPGLMTPASDQMSFVERLLNFINLEVTKALLPVFQNSFQELYRERRQDFPDLLEIYKTASLVFMNGEPLIDFPRIVTHKVIDIGGIAVQSKHNHLNSEWSEILSRRSKNVLLSFGTVAKSFLMPDEYKDTIRETIKKFPDITFIWKYEEPSHNISQGIDNIVECPWLPQTDLLYDPRISLFITHCGAGSTMEATYAGKPLIVIPILGDQLRNAETVKRMGTGVVVEKTDLDHTDALENAIKEVLQNSKYREAAERTADMIRHRPFAMSDIFVRNMEFMVKYGPLRMLDHYGTNLSFVEFYLIDVFAFITFIILVVIATLSFAMYYLFRAVRNAFAKSKTE